MPLMSTDLQGLLHEKKWQSIPNLRQTRQAQCPGPTCHGGGASGDRADPEHRLRLEDHPQRCLH